MAAMPNNNMEIKSNVPSGLQKVDIASLKSGDELEICFPNGSGPIGCSFDWTGQRVNVVAIRYKPTQITVDWNRGGIDHSFSFDPQYLRFPSTPQSGKPVLIELEKAVDYLSNQGEFFSGKILLEHFSKPHNQYQPKAEQTIEAGVKRLQSEFVSKLKGGELFKVQMHDTWEHTEQLAYNNQVGKVTGLNGSDNTVCLQFDNGVNVWFPCAVLYNAEQGLSSEQPSPEAMIQAVSSEWVPEKGDLVITNEFETLSKQHYNSIKQFFGKEAVVEGWCNEPNSIRPKVHGGWLWPVSDPALVKKADKPQTTMQGARADAESPNTGKPLAEWLEEKVREKLPLATARKLYQEGGTGKELALEWYGVEELKVQTCTCCGQIIKQNPAI